jgi:hypothetical protein
MALFMKTQTLEVVRVEVVAPRSWNGLPLVA